MTLQQCRYIMEIERCRSLTEAAKRLFVTQPSITKAMRELEKELGITILKRTNRGVDFTPDTPGSSSSRPTPCAVVSPANTSRRR